MDKNENENCKIIKENEGNDIGLEDGYNIEKGNIRIVYIKK